MNRPFSIMPKRLRAALLGLAAATAIIRPAAASNELTGWTIAGAEFGDVPGRYGYDYTYPSPEELDYLSSKGMNVLRLPVRWERLQTRLFDQLSTGELSHLDATISAASGRGLAVIVDVHNYARYGDGVIGSAQVPENALADLWQRLAIHFKTQDRVVFGLMNEPHDLPTSTWMRAVNAAVQAIRSVGAQNMILLPGSAWTGAHNWSEGGADSNANVMTAVRDPCGNMAFELHQYFDADFSGTKPQCTGSAGALGGLRDVTGWLRAHDARGFLAEFGAGSDPSCAVALKAAMVLMAQNPDVWTGWTSWAAGSWWGADYPLSLQPQKGIDRPQARLLAQFAAARPVPKLNVCALPK